MVNFYFEQGKDIPIIADVDVLICGGGPAGIGAAIRAGNLGVSTMLIEMQNRLGGIATAGLMSHWTGYSSSLVLQEILKEQNEKGLSFGNVPDENQYEDKFIDQESLSVILDEMVKKAHVKILLSTLVCKAVVENHTIIGVIIENKSGRGFIKAKRIIDATGDGDVAASAGVPYFKGRESDGKMQPCTLMFKIGGVDYSKAVFPGSFESLVYTPKGELQSLAKKILPFPAGHVLLMKQRTPGTVCCNMTNSINIDATNGFDVSNATIQCRSQIEPILNFLREYVPGYKHCYLICTASLLGVRETRHFKGLQSLSAEDITSAKFFPDWIVEQAFFNFDVHNMSGASLDETGIQHQWAQPNSYTIPYGCILPQKIDGLLLSGRNISGSHLAHSNFRAMPICIAIGEACGSAAALSIKNNTKLIDVSVEEIQQCVKQTL